MSAYLESTRALGMSSGESTLSGPFSGAIQREIRVAPSRRIGFLYRPGRTMNDVDLSSLVKELHRVAASCFDEVPRYQCLTGLRSELEHNVITLARRPDGSLAGFCSAVILPVPGIGDVLHLGLTCVHPSERGSGLTHRLTSRLAVQYILRHRAFGRQWISNLACVFSSLSNVALHFDDVYPSPFRTKASPQHRLIATEINRHYREKMFVPSRATFDAQRFVFHDSANGTVFEKKSEDRRYHHRNAHLNEFYRRYVDIDAGDEVLQVGSISLLAYPAYWLKRQMARA